MASHSSLENQPDLLTGIFEKPVEFAGFWLRFAAFLIDLILIYIIAVIIGVVIGLNYRLQGKAKMPEEVIDYLVIGMYLCTLLYFPLMESCKWQATLGKRAVSIKVTNSVGQRISLSRALGRYFAKIPSAIILGTGFFMAGFTDKKQALHDLIANTLVVKGRG